MRIVVLWTVMVMGCVEGPKELPPPTFAGICADYQAENGNTYDCTQLDFCDTSSSNLSDRLACCECDEEFCLADPSCP